MEALSVFVLVEAESFSAVCTVIGLEGGLDSLITYSHSPQTLGRPLRQLVKKLLNGSI